MAELLLLQELLSDGADPEPRTLVLVGVTGDGKSSTGNTLCGRAAFATSDGLSSETAEPVPADYALSGEEPGAAAATRGLWRVIDTVGLADTSLPASEVAARFARFANHAPRGVDAFVFCVRWGRFRPEHEAALDAFVRNCGDAALRHTILVFTHCGERSDAAVRAAATGSASPPALRAWVERLGAIEDDAGDGVDRGLEALSLDGAAARAKTPTPPVIGVENRADTAALAAARARVHTALSALRARNAGARYTNAELDAAATRAAAAAEAERAAFAASVADWRKGSGPVRIVREYDAKPSDAPGAAGDDDEMGYAGPGLPASLQSLLAPRGAAGSEGDAPAGSDGPAGASGPSTSSSPQA